MTVHDILAASGGSLVGSAGDRGGNVAKVVLILAGVVVALAVAFGVIVVFAEGYVWLLENPLALLVLYVLVLLAFGVGYVAFGVVWMGWAALGGAIFGLLLWVSSWG